MIFRLPSAAWALGVLLVAFAASGPVAAQQPAPATPSAAPGPAHLAAAKKLLQVTNSDRMFREIFPALLKPMLIEVKKQNPQKVKQVEEVFSLLASRLIAKREGLSNRMAVIYTLELSEAEMIELADFYSHGVGAKYIAAQPKMTIHILKMAQEWMEMVGKDMAVEIRHELDKHGLKY